jgi:hypothetical protein
MYKCSSPPFALLRHGRLQAHNCGYTAPKSNSGWHLCCLIPTARLQASDVTGSGYDKIDLFELSAGDELVADELHGLPCGLYNFWLQEGDNTLYYLYFKNLCYTPPRRFRCCPAAGLNWQVGFKGTTHRRRECNTPKRYCHHF